MKDFDWEGFKKGDYIIVCKTRHITEDCINECQINGIKAEEIYIKTESLQNVIYYNKYRNKYVRKKIRFK